MNLIIDIGNTLAKLAVSDGDRIVAEHTAEQLHASTIEQFLAAWPVRRAIVASTRGECGELLQQLRERVDFVLEFTPQTPVPIRNAYLTPETLGRDRLAAAVGVATLYPARNVLLVDFGTALTIDLVGADNTFRGGVISPGLQTRFRALHDYTAALPLCALPVDEQPAVTVSGTDAADPAAIATTFGGQLIGRTTREAIERGVLHGMVFEIEGYIAHMREEIAGLQVIFTGGDAKFFGKRIKNAIFANCNPVFCGLNTILAYNASEK